MRGLADLINESEGGGPDFDKSLGVKRDGLIASISQ